MEGPLRNGTAPKIVVIGGGTGISNLLRGLKRHPVDLTAIVTMFDSGGSSGLLRKEFGYPPFGDLRQCLLALADESLETRALREAFQFRFKRDSSLNGHSIGNLILAALTTLGSDLGYAVQEISALLRVTGRVVPIALEPADLCAELEGGQVIRGESDIDLRSTPLPRIRRVFLEPEVEANPVALQRIAEADAIVLGPGDLYTSVIPNLLARHVAEAIASSKATKIYVCNLMTKLGETDGFKASDFVREMLTYLRAPALDWAIINTRLPSPSALEAYQREGAYPVEPDLEQVARYVSSILTAELASDELPLRHDAQRTAAAILEITYASPVAHPSPWPAISNLPCG